MAQQDQRAFALLADEQLDAVGGNGALGSQIAFPPCLPGLLGATIGWFGGYRNVAKKLCCLR
jgi:hypothetical protein